MWSILRRARRTTPYPAFYAMLGKASVRLFQNQFPSQYKEHGQIEIVAAQHQADTSGIQITTPATFSNFSHRVVTWAVAYVVSFK